MEINKPESQYTMIDWWKKVVFNNYANFTGRARRAEFWYFYLMQIIILLGLYFLFFVFFAAGGAISNENEDLSVISMVGFLFYGLAIIYSLATIIPVLAVIVRRLHDINKSGWYYLISLIPLVGSILLIVWLATEGDKGKNNYGNDPKNPNNEIGDIGKVSY